MKLLNRSAFVVLPKMPFVQWTHQLQGDELHAKIGLEEQRKEGTVYLIDEVACEDDLDKALQRNWQMIFENELSAWDEFGDQWPAELSATLFSDWFDVYPQVMALDLSESPLLLARLDAE